MFSLIGPIPVHVFTNLSVNIVHSFALKGVNLPMLNFSLKSHWCDFSPLCGAHKDAVSGCDAWMGCWEEAF